MLWSGQGPGTPSRGWDKEQKKPRIEMPVTSMTETTQCSRAAVPNHRGPSPDPQPQETQSPRGQFLATGGPALIPNHRGPGPDPQPQRTQSPRGRGLCSGAAIPNHRGSGPDPQPQETWPRSPTTGDLVPKRDMDSHGVFFPDRIWPKATRYYEFLDISAVKGMIILDRSTFYLEHDFICNYHNTSNFPPQNIPWDNRPVHNSR